MPSTVRNFTGQEITGLTAKLVYLPPLNIVFGFFRHKTDALEHIGDVVYPSLLDAKLISSFVQVNDLVVKTNK